MDAEPKIRKFANIEITNATVEMILPQAPIAANFVAKQNE
jgi:hypothetical protein